MFEDVTAVPQLNGGLRITAEKIFDLATSRIVPSMVRPIGFSG